MPDMIVNDRQDARATLYSLDGVGPLFFQHMDDALIPTLHVIHRFPDHFPRVRVDRGAIRFVLSGAALMVPGLTSPGGRLPKGLTKAATPQTEEGGEAPALGEGGISNCPLGEGLMTSEDERYYEQPELPAGTVVIVEAEGKEQACCVGVLKMGTEEMKSKKKGIGIENGHYLGDGLWGLKV
jgi:PUA domain protein